MRALCGGCEAETPVPADLLRDGEVAWHADCLPALPAPDTSKILKAIAKSKARAAAKAKPVPRDPITVEDPATA